MGNFFHKSVEPERGRNPWEVQQKSPNLYLFLLLQIIPNQSNLFLAVVLICLKEHFRPLAKTKLKTSVEKGLNGQSCFGFPNVGDVERFTSQQQEPPKFTLLRLSQCGRC